MPAIVIIPSRFASTRFPGKPLCPLFGKPIIQHVYERAREARLIQGTFVATDDSRIFDAVESFGGKAVMTSPEHRSGTDRIAEAVIKLDEEGFRLGSGDVVVNVQGDEPMIHPSMVDAVVELMDDPRVSIGTLSKRIEHEEDAADPNVVKIVANGEGFALYFSRAPIPYHRDGDNRPRQFYKHIGIYAYRKEALLAFSKLLPTGLESIEKLEQLRALEHGFKIKVKETPFDTIGVDTPRDLERVEKCLSLYS